MEVELAELGAPNLRLREGRATPDRMAPGDELWEYGATESVATVAESTDKIAGFEQMLDGELLDRIGLSEPSERIVGFARLRCGSR